MDAEERALRRHSTVAAVARLASLAAAFRIGAAVAGLPVDMADRLAFAALFFAAQGDAAGDDPDGLDHPALCA